MPKPRRYYVVSELPQGPFYLNPERGLFSIVVPIARTNLITNPSAETNATGYTAVGGGASVSRTYGTNVWGSSSSYHGAYAIVASIGFGGASDGMYYGPVTLTAGTVYAYSCKFIGDAGAKYKISIATTGAVDLTVYRFRGTNRWQWVWGYWKETSTTSRRFYITRDSDTAGANTGAGQFIVDGLQIEAINAGETVSTYIDGDQQGLLPNQFPYPYRWNGTPHASTSTRDVTTRAGGYVLNLDRFRFRLMAFMGLGITLVSNVASVNAGSDGSTFQAMIAGSRQVAIRGRFEAATPNHLRQIRSDLYSIVGPDSATPRQPLTLMYQPLDGIQERGDFGRIVASYQDGLPQVATPLPAEEATITFTQYLPAIYTNESGVPLTVQTSVTNANAILQRAVDGTWSAMGTGASTGASKVVRAIVVGIDGAIYAGGDFDTMGGVASTSKIAKWDPTTQAWSALGTGITGGSVFALAVGPDGTLYAGGNFTTSGGVATANISKWNGAAWSTVGTSGDINAQVSALAINTNGLLYVGGAFSNAGAIAAADSIATWSGSAWAALGASGLNNSVESLTVGMDGITVYLGGNFTTAGGVTGADRIAYWDGSAYQAMGTGANSTVMALATTRDGRIYAGGSFTTINGLSVSSVAVWNGTGWQALSSGVNNTARSFAQSLDGSLYVGGDFTTAGGITLPDRAARWGGSQWVAVDIDFPGSPQVGALAVSRQSGILYAGFSTTGTATAAGVTTATNSGTALTYPAVAITGPSSGTSRIYQLLNATTGKLIYLNLTISAGETITLRTSSNGSMLISSFRGDVSNAVLPGSASDFALKPGANSISFFAASSTVTALMRWATALQSADDLAN
jgi:hypothetical protein